MRNLSWLALLLPAVANATYVPLDGDAYGDVAPARKAAARDFWRRVHQAVDEKEIVRREEVFAKAEKLAELEHEKTRNYLLEAVKKIRTSSHVMIQHA